MNVVGMLNSTVSPSIYIVHKLEKNGRQQATPNGPETGKTGTAYVAVATFADYDFRLTVILGLASNGTARLNKLRLA
jgi:hypothetical protein